MKRRAFLQRVVPASTIPFFLGGYSLRAYGRSPFIDRLLSLATETDRVFVLVQLNGGNDGLNMVIPRDQYAALAVARSNIMIPEAKVLPLTTVTGLHPAMTGLQSLYQEGKLAVVQSVGYPSPNFSHFRATDIWLTASDSNQILTSGWMGRYLDAEFPGFPLGYPRTAMPDPPAIQIGSVVSSGLQGSAAPMGIAITNPNSSYLLPGGEDTPPATPAGHELAFIRQIAQQTQQYSTVIKTAAGKGTNKSTLYPAAGQNSLADQLKIVAQLVAGGLKTRVYVVNYGGFDTHSAQVVAGTTDTGTHATLLGRVSLAIAAFMDDLKLLGQDQRVVGMTFSEFGRRVKSNASAGTDHGAAAPLFVFGANIQGAVVGANPTLPAAATVNDNIPMLYDFRMVYASILKDWFGASPAELQGILPNHTQTLPLIKSGAVLAVEEGESAPSSFALEQNYPNPFNPTTTIRYALPRTGMVRIEVYDITGQRIRLLVDREEPAGVHSVAFDAGTLASGTYFYRMQAGEFVETKRLVVLR
jgi:uncharacterized protein (DUF1501 family)